ncbi:MAG TPA: alpha/beta fold hydrolase [Vicinamibacterales bacterium]|nr:alpha/beta fold hydrolase [Vicinamibacterales bacterium]
MRHTVLADGRRFTCLEAGTSDGPALVFLHAFPLTADMWREQLAAPPQGWRVLAPDFAGFGGSSDHDREQVSLHDYAWDVVRFLDCLGVQRAVVAGLSMGGYVALALARLAPDRLKGLVLADTRSAADSEQARAGRERMLGILRDRGVEGVADEMLPKLLGTTTRQSRPELVAEVRSLILSCAPEGIRRAVIRLRDRPDATPTLDRIRVPALVLCGEEDVVTPPEEGRTLAAGLPDAAFEVLHGAGHLSNLEAAPAFNAAVARFVSTL